MVKRIWVLNWLGDGGYPHDYFDSWHFFSSLKKLKKYIKRELPNYFGPYYDEEEKVWKKEYDYYEGNKPYITKTETHKSWDNRDITSTINIVTYKSWDDWFDEEIKAVHENTCTHACWPLYLDEDLKKEKKQKTKNEELENDW